MSEKRMAFNPFHHLEPLFGVVHPSDSSSDEYSSSDDDSGSDNEPESGPQRFCPANEVSSGGLSVRGVKRPLEMIDLSAGIIEENAPMRAPYMVFGWDYHPWFAGGEPRDLTIFDIMERASQHFNFHPSALRLKWKELHLCSTATLCELMSEVGPTSSALIIVEVVPSINAESIARQVRAASITPVDLLPLGFIEGRSDSVSGRLQ